MSLRIFALSLVAASVALAAPVHAEGTDEQRSACTNDAFKFCSAHIPDEGAIEGCLRSNHARLSPSCQMVMQQSAPAEATPRMASARSTGRRSGGAMRSGRQSGGDAMGAVAGMMQLLPAITGGDSIFDDD